MEYRFLGNTGLRVSALAYGTLTFGGHQGWFKTVGTTGVEEAQRLVNVCIDAGVSLFDTADVYSNGASEEILGRALGGSRQRVLVSTKAHGRMGEGPNDVGSSRDHLIRSCEASLRRLGTDWIDIYFVHGVDERTPFDETLAALTNLVRAGKIRYIGCSNFSGWHLMKALALSDHRGLERYSCQQVYYSLLARELEHELIPLALDQGVGTMVWSPLAMGWLSGKYRRGNPYPEGSRTPEVGTVDAEHAFTIIDVLEQVAGAHQATVGQIALAWALGRPSVASVVFGARDERQLQENLAAVDVSLTPEDINQLEQVSRRPLPYPYWHQRQYNAERLVVSSATV